jgi:hypothetical protein
MAQDFKINGTTISRVNRPDWIDEPANKGLDPSTPRLRWARCVCRADVLTAAEFDLLYAVEGSIVSIDVTPYEDRNAADYKRYFGVLCTRVSGSHDGPAFTAVEAEFLVKII